MIIDLPALDRSSLCVSARGGDDEDDVEWDEPQFPVLGLVG